MSLMHYLVLVLGCRRDVPKPPAEEQYMLAHMQELKAAGAGQPAARGAEEGAVHSLGLALHDGCAHRAEDVQNTVRVECLGQNFCARLVSLDFNSDSDDTISVAQSQLNSLDETVHSGIECLPSITHVCSGKRIACTAFAQADMCWHVQQAEAAANAQQNEAFEIDQWILDFANLFREQLNIEPDKHLDLTNMGWDKLQAALDSAVQSDKAHRHL